MDRRIFWIYGVFGVIFSVAAITLYLGPAPSDVLAQEYREQMAYREEVTKSLLTIDSPLEAQNVPPNTPVFLRGQLSPQPDPALPAVDREHGVRFQNSSVRAYELRISVDSGDGIDFNGRPEMSPLYLHGIQLRPPKTDPSTEDSEFAWYQMIPSTGVPSEIVTFPPEGQYQGWHHSIESPGFLYLTKLPGPPRLGDLGLSYASMTHPPVYALGSVRDGVLVPLSLRSFGYRAASLPIFRVLTNEFDPVEYLEAQLSPREPPEDLVAVDRNRRRYYAPTLGLIGVFFFASALRFLRRRRDQTPRL